MQLIGGDPEYSRGGEYASAIPLLAVHAGISIADALLVFQRGKRGSDPNHQESVRELNILCSEIHVDNAGVSHYTWLVENKTDLVYDDRRTDYEQHIKKAALQAERFVRWVYKTFPGLARYSSLEQQ
jgi:hypothetical protein